MIASEKQSVEDMIIEILAKNPYLKGPDLVLAIQKIRAGTIKQTVYFALKDLLKSETVAKVGSKYFLSRLWLHKINKLFKIQKEKEITRDAIFDLKEKESISYYFPTLLACDTYWGHVINVLTEWLTTSCPIFVWNPHDFFVIARKEIEENFFDEVKSENKYCFFVIGGNTSLDKEFKRVWTNNHASISINEKVHFPKTYYLNIFADFVIEVFLDEKFANQIEAFYQKNQNLTEENIKEFQELIIKKYPVRMKISRKKEKASALRKKLAKDFYIPKHLKL